MGNQIYFPVDENETRIAVLQPGQFIDDIHVSLQNQSLNPADQGEIEPYEALSYCWGTGAAQETVLVDNSPLKATLNLVNALRYLRYPDRPRKLWIDSISINQEDIPERSRHVLRMNKIYKQASQVLVWLGESVASTETAITWFQEWSTYRWMGVQHDNLPFYMLEDRQRARRSPEDVAAVAEFLSRPWWSRVWTFQEVVLATKAELICGTYVLSWDAFATAIDTYQGSSLHNIAYGIAAESVLTRWAYSMTEYGGGNANRILSTVVRRTMYFQATDPRDKIYGILGLEFPEAGWDKINIVPDYDAPLEDVYGAITLSCIYGEQNLQIFQTVIKTRRDLNWPSWVLNLRDVSGAYGMKLEGRTPYSVNRGFKPTMLRNPQHEGDCRRLTIEGARIDKIASILELTDVITLLSDEMDKDYSDDAYDPWESLAGFIRIIQATLDVPDHYESTNESMLLALLRTLTIDFIPSSGRLHWSSYVRSAFPEHYYWPQKSEEEISKAQEDEPYDLSADQVATGPSLIRLYDLMLEHNGPKGSALDEQLHRLVFRKHQPRVAFPDLKSRILMAIELATTIQKWLNDRVLFVTETGRLGNGPQGTSVGDEIFSLFGAEIPFVLCPVVDSKNYRLIGESYVHGIMDGELWHLEGGPPIDPVASYARRFESRESLPLAETTPLEGWDGRVPKGQGTLRPAISNLEIEDVTLV